MFGGSDDLTLRLGGDASGAINAMAQAQARAKDFASEMVSEIGKVVATVFSLEKAFEGLRAGIIKADEIRDLQLSLNVFTGSVESGTKAMEFFERQADKTRNTAIELGKAFRDMLPQALGRGFGVDAVETLTPMLSQLATMRGVSLDAMETGFRRLLSGSPMVARNPLMAALGFTKENVDVTWKEVIDRLNEKVAGFDQFGQSFESTMLKIKDAWTVAFGDGFNKAMGGGREAFDNLRAALTNPQFLAGLADIGAGFAHVVVGVSNLVAGLHELGNMAPPAWMQWVTDRIVGAGGTPQDLRDFSGQGPGQSNGAWSGSRGVFGRPSIVPDDSAANGTLLDTNEALKIRNRALADEADHLGKVAIAAKKANDEWDRYVLAAAGRSQYMLTGIGPDLPPGYNPITGRYAAPPDVTSPFFGPQSNIGTGGTGMSFGSPMMGGPQMIANAETWGKTSAESFKKAALQDQFLADFGSAMYGILKDGGRHMAQSFGQDFNRLIKEGITTGAAKLFGTPTTYNPDGSINQVGVAGAFGETGSRIAQGAMGVASIGFGAYEGALSGAPGSRTSGTISGGIAGAGLGYSIGSAVAAGATAGSVAPIVGTVVGAVVGLIVGAVGSYLGQQAHQAQYMYGIPGIDKNGQATLTSDKNLTPAMISDIKAKVQAEYDQIHDALITLILKFPDVAIPSAADITGKFQDNPSAHWGEHLALWISGTLPKEMISAVGDELSTGFGQLGMAPKAFKKLFDEMGNLDPTKVINLLNTLADALKSLFDPKTGSSTFFHANTGYGVMAGTSGSESFQQGMNDLSRQARFTPGQSLQESDAAIFKLVGSLNGKGLSPESQIATLDQIAQLSKARYDAEKAAILAIYNVAVQMKQQFQDARDTLALQALIKPDGSPDFYSQSQFYKKRADTDLQQIASSTNAADAQKFAQAFIKDVMTAEQLGIQSGGNLKDWNDWATKALPKGEGALDGALNRLGDSINKQNDIYNSIVDPALALFTGNLGDTGTAVGDVGKGFKDLIPPMDHLRDRFHDLSDAVDTVIGSLNSAASNFAAKTVQQRSRAA